MIEVIMLNGNNVHKVLVVNESILIVSKFEEYKISIEECFFGWRDFVQNEMGKDLTGDTVWCVALTYAKGGKPVVQFLDHHKTVVEFPITLFGLKTGHKKMVRFIRMLNECGFTTFNID